MNKFTDEQRLELALNENARIKEALKLAMEALSQISSESATLESSYDDLVKLENRVTKKAFLTLKQINKILNGA